MSAQHRDDAPRHTGLAIAVLLAIPFASVTLAARLGSAASSTDPREAVAAGVALLGGMATGLLVRRLVVAVDRNVRGVFHFLVARGHHVAGIADNAVSAGWARRDNHRVLAVAFLPSAVGRRGPPIRLR